MVEESAPGGITNLPSIHSLVDSVFSAIGREARARSADLNGAAIASSTLDQEARNCRTMVISASEVAIRDRRLVDCTALRQPGVSTATGTASSKIADPVGQVDVRETDAGEHDSLEQRAEPKHGNGLRMNRSCFFLMRSCIPTTTNAASFREWSRLRYF